MSKRGFVRGARTPAPPVPPARVIVAPPLALPEREPRNILLMIALPAVLVGIIGTLVVMYTSGVRSLQSGFFPMIGLVGFGALIKHHAQFKRIAIVTNLNWATHTIHALAWMIPGEMKTFTLDELDQAKEWAAS